MSAKLRCYIYLFGQSFEEVTWVDKNMVLRTNAENTIDGIYKYRTRFKENRNDKK